MTTTSSVPEQYSLQPFQNTAGHDGIMSGFDGEVIVKPCTQAEVDFYEETVNSHADFLQYIPAFLGTLHLGTPASMDGVTVLPSAVDEFVKSQSTVSQGHTIAAETAIVLENLELGFVRPNVIDIKLGSRLYAPGTKAEKAARLDKVAAKTTTGSLNYRIAGMRVWNAELQNYDIYDKQYGRKFDSATVADGFETFFKTLLQFDKEMQSGMIGEIRSELAGARQLLHTKTSRFYSSSILIVYEGEHEALLDKYAALSSTSRSEEDSNGDSDGDEEEISRFQMAQI